MSMRVSGLASGMNTDEIIAKMLSANRIPMDKLKQQKQLLEWKRDDYRTLNTRLMAFRDAAFNMRLEGSYMVKKASSSNEAAVSVSGTGDANDGRYTIRIDELAEAAAHHSSQLGATQGLETKLQTLGLTDGASLTVGGAKGTVKIEVSEEQTVSQLVSTINSYSSQTGVRAAYDATMDRLFFTTSQTGADSNITLRMEGDDPAANLLSTVLKVNTSPTGVVHSGAQVLDTADAKIDSSLTGTERLTLKVAGNSYNFDVNKDSTVDSLMEQINKSLGKEGVSVQLKDDRLEFFNAKGKTLAFEATSPGLLDKLGLNAMEPPQSNIHTLSTSGKNAVVTFNGETAEYQSNSFTVLGMNVTAKQKTTEGVNITVTHDVDAAFNNIKSFVDKYNELIDTVNSKLAERKYRDFPPLTDEQRKDMSEDDIKRWEEKARSGTLANDNLLSQGLFTLRSTMNSSVSGLANGHFSSLSDIGVSNVLVKNGIVSGNYTDKGKLYIDENKLKQALTDRPEEVVALFRTVSDDPELPSGNGVAMRLHAQVSGLLTNITAKAGAVGMVEDNYSMGKEMQRHDDRIERMTRRLEDLEKRYYKQFSAMETYLNRMNSQSAWLAQQFSTGG